MIITILLLPLGHISFKKNTILGATKITRSPPSTHHKLLIFGESKAKALIHILAKAIHFSLSFA
jgi:hypothetical protein